MAADETSELIAITNELLMLICETAEYHSDPEVRSVLLEASRAIAGIRHRLVIVTDRYVVAVVGLTNVGKSTLMNALLGVDVAPCRNGPCTAVPIEFVYGEPIRVTIYHQRNLSRPSWRCRDFEEVHERLGHVADNAADTSNRTIRKAVIEAPIALLKDGLVISDTPGFGAAEIDESASTHEAVLKKYLQEDVSQAFWVVLAEQGIGNRELSFHDSFFGDVCDDIIVTGCEGWESGDKARFRRRFVDALYPRMPRFHFVSGLQGVRARRAADRASLEKAGITLLERRVRELTDCAGRLKAIQGTLLELADDLRFWLAAYRDANRLPLRQWWRTDSWVRWSHFMTDRSFKQDLHRLLKHEQ